MQSPPGQRPGLTRKQAAILAEIRRYSAANGYPPSLRDLAEAVGLTSPSSAAYHLTVLESLGYIHRVPGRPRALTVLDPTETPHA